MQHFPPFGPVWALLVLVIKTGTGLKLSPWPYGYHLQHLMLVQYLI